LLSDERALRLLRRADGRQRAAQSRERILAQSLRVGISVIATSMEARMAAEIAMATSE
jgi:hypothetical protein